MSKFYAQLNENGICVAVTAAHSKIDLPNMIELETFEADKLGKVYDRVTRTFTSIPKTPIRTITTQAFFRRLTKNERAVLRSSALNEVADLREDLQRSVTVDLDGTIEQQLTATELLTQTRIDTLLADGTVEEAHNGT